MVPRKEVNINAVEYYSQLASKTADFRMETGVGNMADRSYRNIDMGRAIMAKEHITIKSQNDLFHLFSML